MLVVFYNYMYTYTTGIYQNKLCLRKMNILDPTITRHNLFRPCI